MHKNLKYSNNNPKTSAILLAGGIGSRMGSSFPKQFLSLHGKPIALYSYQELLQTPEISEIVVVCEKQYQKLFPKAIFANPGKRRQDSLFNGLKKVSSQSEFILIHDSARPFIDRKLILATLVAGYQYGAATPAIPLKGTIKQSYLSFVTQTVDRAQLFEAQTPQVIKKSILEKGFKKEINVTDDVSFAEHLSYPVKIIEGDEKNIKITTPFDMKIAKVIANETTL